MNFLDNYDIASSGSSTPPPNQPQQSLNEEVNQVIGQIGRLWMGFRKQSQTVFQTAQRDFGDAVPQTQRETSTTAEETKPSSTTPIASSIATLNDTDVNTAASTSAEPSDSSSSQSIWNTQALFSRLQSALPPNVVSTVQSHIPESIKYASGTIDLAQIRTNLLSEVQRIQGVTRAQAEEYAHKSEALLREAVKEAQEVLRDAVKVIPPEETSSRLNSTSSGFNLGGSNMSPEDVEVTGTTVADTTVDSGKGKRASVDAGMSAVNSRAEVFLTRLTHDPTIMRTDPALDTATKELYRAWIQKEVALKNGGLEGEEWRTTITKSLEDPANGKALMCLKEAVVPSDMTEIEFWQRFFFRSHQIKEEEEKRKAVLQVNTESEDDFDWDNEDSEDDKEVVKETTPTRSLASAIKEKSSQVPPSSAASTRDSSLDSFDVVSSANASSSGDTTKQLDKVATKHQNEGSEGKKDGEEEKEGEEEEEEEEEEDDDSDWE